MPREGWTVITIHQDPHDRAEKFVRRLNEGKKYQKERISLGDFTSSAILEKLQRDQAGEQR